MLLILLSLLGLLALDTVHASPLTEVKIQDETLALDNVHTAASTEVQLQDETLALDNVHTAASAEVQLQDETLALDNVHTAASAEVKLQDETLAVDNVHTAASAEVKLQRGSCPPFWFSFNGRCYKYVATDYTWGEAEWNCLSQGANLVSIHSREEHNFVRELIQNFDPEEGHTWIGITDIHLEGNWMWSDGSKVDFTFWEVGQPDNRGNEDCVEIDGNTKWNDLACSNNFPSVCVSRTICP